MLHCQGLSRPWEALRHKYYRNVVNSYRTCTFTADDTCRIEQKKSLRIWDSADVTTGEFRGLIEMELINTQQTEIAMSTAKVLWMSWEVGLRLEHKHQFLTTIVEKKTRVMAPIDPYLEIVIKWSSINMTKTSEYDKNVHTFFRGLTLTCLFITHWIHL